MNLIELLDFLYCGAYPVWKDLVLSLSNADIKALRLVHRSTSDDLFPFLFSRIYISAHDTDLEVFRRIAYHPTASHSVRELIWDDCTFDRWISGQQTYTDRLVNQSVLPSHVLKREQDVIAEAYRFWASEAASFDNNRRGNLDQQFFNNHISSFPNLASIIILSRSRLTYVDPAVYWSLWQTPRSRIWASKPFARHLLQPEPFKPSIGTTDHESEGMRPIQIIRTVSRSRPDTFKIGHLSITSIGGGQSRPSGSTMLNATRFDRLFHIDLAQLTSPTTRPAVPKGKVALQLFLETQTADLFRNPGVLEDNLDLLMVDTASNLESLTVANLCLDWLLHHCTIVNSPVPYLRALKRVTVQGGCSDDPLKLLRFARLTGVREIMFDQLQLEAITWSEVLQALRREGIAFDVFELRPSRARAQLFPQQAEVAWQPPKSGFSDKIVAYLKGETEEVPLLCA